MVDALEAQRKGDRPSHAIW